jgi:hypothetical protein
MKLCHCYHNNIFKLVARWEKYINVLSYYVAKRRYFSEANKRFKYSGTWCCVTGYWLPAFQILLKTNELQSSATAGTAHPATK